MKGILIFLTIFIPFVMNSKNYFKDGMEWRTLVWGTHEPVPTYGMETVTLEKSADNDMLKMYRYSDNDISDRKFVAFVRTDGDKVFFKVDESDTSEWYLMYDFGLKPGEGCYIYSPRVVSENKSPFVKMYLKCVNVLTDAGGWDIMTLEEYEDDSCQEIPGHNISVTWIKGLSSTRGVLWNNRFNSDGGSGLLKEVYDLSLIHI